MLEFSIYQSAQTARNARGYITLMSVLVLGAVGVALTISLILLGLGASRTGFAVEQSNQAKAIVNACSEEGLMRIRESTSFTGSGNLTLGSGNCVYTVTSQGGQNRTVSSTGTVGTLVRKVRILVTAITPAITLASWQEVP